MFAMDLMVFERFKSCGESKRDNKLNTQYSICYHLFVETFSWRQRRMQHIKFQKAFRPRQVLLQVNQMQRKHVNADKWSTYHV